MIKHVVLFTFRKDLPRPRIAAIMEGFRGLAGRIPGILSYHWGFNNSPEGYGRGYTCAFVMELADAQARTNYLEHPEHVAFANGTIIPALERGIDSVLVFDFDG